MMRRTHRTWIYIFLYTILVVTRFVRGIRKGAADAISLASTEVLNLGAISFCIVADFSSSGVNREKNTYGNRRLHVLAALVLCVVIIVNLGLNLLEVLDDLSWLPDKESLWDKKEINMIQAAAGFVGMVLFRNSRGVIVNRAVDINRRGIYIHALSTFVEAFSTLLISFFTPNQHRMSLLLNVFGALATSIVVILIELPLMRFILQILLHATTSEQSISLRKRLVQLSNIPGLRDCEDVHFWTETEGIHICTMKIIVARDADAQSILASAFEIFDDLLDDLTIEVDLERD
ncbi:hypothetical protein NDN08_002471 [Rhodosorus marinus]|uniref:Cation efflux protein cytoplasmic domain-containing protein n=1 Tax=Rhodosorus marinus TaxID=101924 RepID=A0AAV8UTT7_9RHOD|nr:hypothetical protein NDN08_002471 [Rhodosorus marinus]